jgi:hypothetical protein
MAKPGAKDALQGVSQETEAILVLNAPHEYDAPRAADYRVFVLEQNQTQITLASKG